MNGNSEIIKSFQFYSKLLKSGTIYARHILIEAFYLNKNSQLGTKNDFLHLLKLMNDILFHIKYTLYPPKFYKRLYQMKYTGLYYLFIESYFLNNITVL